MDSSAGDFKVCLPTKTSEQEKSAPGRLKPPMIFGSGRSIRLYQERRLPGDVADWQSAIR
jgi:hypothetical protein